MFLNLENLYKVPASLIEKEQACFEDFKDHLYFMFLLNKPSPASHCEEELCDFSLLYVIIPSSPQPSNKDVLILRTFIRKA